MIRFLLYAIGIVILLSSLKSPENAAEMGPILTVLNMKIQGLAAVSVLFFAWGKLHGYICSGGLAEDIASAVKHESRGSLEKSMPTIDDDALEIKSEKRSVLKNPIAHPRP